MISANHRASLQILVLMGIAIFAVITGWACDCGTGSDHYGGSGVTRDQMGYGDGIVERWHDFRENDFTASDKDMQALNDFLAQGSAGFGVLVPQAPGASEPGTLTYSPTQNIFISWNDGVIPHYLSVPITPSQQLAAQLTALMPPPQGTRWQGLVPVPGDWMAEIPTQATNFQDVFGSLHYVLDFKGSDYCNHCEVQLTACSTAPLTAPQEIALQLFGADQFVANDSITCARPVSTNIMLVLEPGPVIASFGPYGSVVYTSTQQSDLTIPYSLLHTSQVTQTLQLSPVASTQGWNYTWKDLSGNPITQLTVGPIGNDLWASYDDNLQIVASGLPTCTHIQDTIYLTATMVTTPSIQAHAWTLVDVLPDPAGCPVVDLGIGQIASTSEISAGNWVTFTLTVTNFETLDQDAIVTQTLSPASAIGGAVLPAGCSRTGGEITCQVSDIPGESSIELVIAIQAANTFTGVMGSSVEVQPVGASDLRYYDNTDGWLPVTVTGGVPSQLELYLPIVRRN